MPRLPPKRFLWPGGQQWDAVGHATIGHPDGAAVPDSERVGPVSSPPWPVATLGKVELVAGGGHNDVAHERVQVRVGSQELPQGEAAGSEILELRGGHPVDLVGAVEVWDL